MSLQNPGGIICGDLEHQGHWALVVRVRVKVRVLAVPLCVAVGVSFRL